MKHSVELDNMSSDGKPSLTEPKDSHQQRQSWWDLSDPILNPGHLIRDHSFGDCSMQLLVSPVFCMVVWFPSRDNAEKTEQITGWLEGTRPRGLH